MHHPLYKVMLYQHEQKECQKNTCTCAVSCSWSWSVRPQSSNFDVTSSSLLFTLLLYPDCVSCSYVLPNRVLSRLRAAKKRPNVSLRSTFFSLVVLWAFAKHLGCCFPSSVSSVVPLTCVVHSCSPLFIKGCLLYLKKARRPLPEVWCLMRSLAWFVLFVFQWEASQQTHRPLLCLSLLCILKTENQLFLCHRFELNQPTIQNCVWIC